ncbi:polysaccharide biosynthesis protein [Flocculibacter collagenilyticus]|uniref:polysaccharide biosynthesis protein n=1 Tax=Flocculibacter collagenilyticus TaxID=2744479 RepID=UPI0018F63816|nr:nucleoside-diphosphate sugar epimerase/dehydratase [Flocculibacter collagenilyticus]
MSSLLFRFFEIPRIAKRIVTISVDVLFIISAFFLSLIVRLGEDFISWLAFPLLLTLALSTLLTIVIWAKLGLYRAIIRYIDAKAISNIIFSSFVSAIILMLTGFILDAALPRSIPILYFAFVLIFVATSRLTIRAILQDQHFVDKAPVIIYGAGITARQLCLSLQHASEFLPVGYIDDNKNLVGRHIGNVPVYSTEHIASLIEVKGVSKILLAIPDANVDETKKIIEQLSRYEIQVLKVPSSADIVNGKFKVDDLRTIAVEDLLGREAVTPKPSLLGICIKEKTVLVTGAGGSIGSELCRQIVNSQPSQIILFEMSEYNLYAIEKELKHVNPLLEVTPILGSVCDKSLVNKVIDRFNVNTIYHAAAYKHVPLTELNIANCLRNNIWGTQHVAEAALNHNVEHFILVSTDKAVRPTNIMGASKRIAELILQSLNDLVYESPEHKTVFSMVRFGNVLGSSGSVVPLFKHQIEQGGPVTVTHPQMTRYFMTIPEAASLVIQAGAMAEGGDVYVLDMGEPVRILDLAIKMIHLMGFKERLPNQISGDIKVTFSGLRQGEKLFEELLIDGDVISTPHPRIGVAQEIKLTSQELSALLTKLDGFIEAEELNSIRELLKSANLGYMPNMPISDLMLTEKDNGNTPAENILLNTRAPQVIKANSLESLN